MILVHYNCPKPYFKRVHFKDDNYLTFVTVIGGFTFQVELTSESNILETVFHILTFSIETKTKQ